VVSSRWRAVDVNVALFFAQSEETQQAQQAGEAPGNIILLALSLILLRRGGARRHLRLRGLCGRR
jgi:hypothetical protein